MREKERLLMEMVEWGAEHLIWKEGWPQPGEEEKGNGGGEANGGHENVEEDDGFGKHEWAAVAAE